jgi:hypothetical protein
MPSAPPFGLANTPLLNNPASPHSNPPPPFANFPNSISFPCNHFPPHPPARPHLACYT